jgi:hypothetical protein
MKRALLFFAAVILLALVATVAARALSGLPLPPCAPLTDWPCAAQ